MTQGRVLRVIRARPRLFIAAGVALLVGALLPQSVASHSLTRALITWNVGTLHCVLAYLFNTIVLALLINISASLL